MKLSLLILPLFAALTLSSCSNYKKNENPTVITIGSGSKNAMFYPVATALCDVFNHHNQDKNVTCEARISKGAEYNLNAVENGEFTMGISQANLQFDAYNGNKQFAGNPHKNLRSLFGLHYEYMTIIAKKDAGIKSFADLKGKRVNIGNPGSGSRILFLQMIEKLGWNLSDFAQIYEESGSDINKVLCVPNKADAAVYIVGHPNKSFGSMLQNCNAELVNLSDDEINKFVSLAPQEFKKLPIPANTYPQTPNEINSFASFTILSTSAKLDDKIVKNFVKTIEANKSELTKKLPALTIINFSPPKTINLAPTHNGLN